MKINNITFEEKVTSEIGLKAIDLDRLGHVVALVGSNGSGKTRFLKFIECNFQEIILQNLKNDEYRLHLSEDICSEYDDFEKKKDELLKKYNIDPSIFLTSRFDKEQQRLKDIKNELQNEIGKIEKKENIVEEKILHDKRAELEELKDRYFSFAETGIAYKDLRNYIINSSRYFKTIDPDKVKALEKNLQGNTFEDLVENAASVLKSDELECIYKEALPYFKKFVNKLNRERRPFGADQIDFEKTEIFIRFNTFREYFNKFFKKELSWRADTRIGNDDEGYWTIDKRKFEYDEFSEGEKILFAYVFMFFLESQNKKIQLKNCIIKIDEPELHLHPEAEINLIEGVRNIIGDKGQLWIATHSISILSNLNYDEIFIMKQGGIIKQQYSKQKQAIIELFRLDEHIDKLSDFLISISEWSFVNFVTECFKNPEALETSGSKDPQIKSFKYFLNSISNTKKVDLLDFGAGKGRLFKQLRSDNKLKDRFNYNALEPDVEMQKELKDIGVQNIIKEYEDLEPQSFDLIVLCNVLHEIPVAKWKSSLDKIIDSLKSEGFLMIIEAKVLSKGEKVGKVGYLLLNPDEIIKLFSLKGKSEDYIYNKNLAEEEKEKIVCVAINESELGAVSEDSMKETMKFLNDRTLNKIGEIKEKKEKDARNNSKLGRDLAFLSQLHINSELALRVLNLTQSQIENGIRQNRL